VEAALQALLRRDRAVTAAGLVVLCVLGWVWLLSGAGLGMDMGRMARLALFPHERVLAMASMPGMDMPAPPPAAWPPALFALTLAMWAAMMVAMMTPSAAPAILLYARVHRHGAAAGGEAAARLAPTGVFAAGYFLLWLGFSVAATLVQWGLAQAGLSDPMAGSGSRLFSAGLLLAAGAYQLSPLQGACLSHCRSPAQFFARAWRPGPWGALRLGLLHGAYCVGCCWLVMALLFVGGVMNLAWIAALAVLVLAEKVAPAGRWMARAAGGLLIAWGVATLLV
jgi:predicted metal-binding membrane protein